MTLTKLLAGALALVLVAGMTSPAFAGGGQCTITQNQTVKVNIEPEGEVVIPKTIECTSGILSFDPDDSECLALGLEIGYEPFLQADPKILDVNEIIFNDGLGTEEGHCSILWTMDMGGAGFRTVTQELWFDVPQVAGQLLPLDSTALFLAGIQSMTVWMIPTVLGLAGAGVYLVKYRARD